VGGCKAGGLLIGILKVGSFSRGRGWGAEPMKGGGEGAGPRASRLTPFVLPGTSVTLVFNLKLELVDGFKG